MSETIDCDRVEANYNDEWNVTHLHLACMFGCDDDYEKFLSLEQHLDNCRPPPKRSRLSKSSLGIDHEYQRSQVNAVDWWGRTPLLLALGNNHKEIALLLLRRGADPNLAGTDGCTPLHLVCCLPRQSDVDDLAQVLFQLKVSVNATDNFGRTPLYYALIRGHKQLSERLLSLGANPNLCNQNGDSLLHLLCKRDRDSSDLVEMLFNFNNKKLPPIKKSGSIPWRDLANVRHKFELDRLIHSHDFTDIYDDLFGPDKLLDVVRALDQVSTRRPLICNINYDDQLVKTFFEICAEKVQRVEVDAKDQLDQTPLQLAVAHLKPDVVSVLLDHGADLSGFVFPTETQFDEGLKSYECMGIKFKLFLASSLVAIYQSLENGGYELDRSDVSTIMKLFAKHGLFEKSADFDKSCPKDQQFTRKARKIKVKPDLSLYALIQLQPNEAAKLLTCKDYLEFSLARQWPFSEEINQACIAHLCEQVSRDFFRKSALYPFQEVIRYRLPIEICEMIVDRDLMNQDLYNICLAAATINLHES